MSSVAGLRGAGAYGAAKAAVNGWTWWMSGRLAADGITVNAVAPGFVPDTEFWTDRIAANPGLPAERTAGIPMQRPGTPTRSPRPSRTSPHQMPAGPRARSSASTAAWSSAADPRDAASEERRAATSTVAAVPRS